MRPIHVVGHKNPDTDSIASAIACAWHLAHELSEPVLAARAGPINPQTTWLLERLGIQAPALLTDVAPQIGWASRPLATVHPDQPLREAWDLLHDTGTVVPVVNAQRRPVGMITATSVFELLRAFVLQGRQSGCADLRTLLEVPSLDAADRSAPSFRARTRIRDELQRVLRDEHDDFLVVDDDGRYVGVCRKPQLLSPERMRLVLVDHNGAGQSVGSLEEADVLEVVDHHRLENLPTRTPIRFTVEPVGSTSTLVWNRIAGGRDPVPASIAALLLGGIYSDTLLLTSPTTTERDRRAAEALRSLAFQPGSPVAGEEADAFGRTLLRAGGGLDARAPREVVCSDLKEYSAARLKFGAAQVEVADEPNVESHVAPLREALAMVCRESGYDFGVLMITEVVMGGSRLVLHEPPAVLSELPYRRLPDDTLEAPGVVSRKKQLLPTILSLLERS